MKRVKNLALPILFVFCISVSLLLFELMDKKYECDILYFWGLLAFALTLISAFFKLPVKNGILLFIIVGNGTQLLVLLFSNLHNLLCRTFDSFTPLRDFFNLFV
jgi:hypothetical protein